MRIGMLLMVLVASYALAQENGAPATARVPQDRHDGLVVSAESYANSDRAKQKFNKANPVPAGILPVEVTVRNETEQPVRIDLSTIKLSVKLREGKRQDVDSLSVDDVAATLAHPGGAATPHTKRFPVGLPSSTDKKVDKMAEILRPLSLDADVVPPMSQIHGFLFFDLNHQMPLAESASLYIPDATRIPSNQPLMFFEVPLGSGQP